MSRQIAGAALKRAHGDIQAAEELHGVAPKLIEPGHAVLRLADYYHFLLFKLVHSVYAALLYAVRADIAGTRLIASAIVSTPGMFISVVTYVLRSE